MNPRQIARKNLRLSRLLMAVGTTVLSACSLPEPDGTEAAIAERAEGLPVLTAAEGRSAPSIARNSLLLSPQVRAAASEVNVSADEVRIQRAAIFPSLSLSLGGGVGDAGRASTSIDLTGRQLILDFGSTKRAVTSADIELQIDYLEFHQAVDEALFDVLEASDAVRKYVLTLEIWRQQLAAMRDLQSKVSSRVDNGAAPVSDALETKKRFQAAQFLVHDTELLLAEARDRLTRLSGQGRGVKIPSLGANACTANENSDDIVLARLQLAQAQIDLEDAINGRKPRAFIEPIARHTVGAPGVSVGLNVGVDSDLLQGGALSARVDAARDSLAAADANVDAARRDSALETSQQKREIAAAAKRRSLLNNQISLLKQTRTLYRSQYFDLGTREISELLDNEEEFYNRRSELVELETELTANRINCAIDQRTIRRTLNIHNNTLYGFPLSDNEF